MDVCAITGYRDSEIAVLVRDEKFADSRMDGKPYKAGRYGGYSCARLGEI